MAGPSRIAVDFSCQIVLASLLAGLLPLVLFSQEGKKSPPDHGRALATCIEVAPGKLKDTTKLSETKNYVFRGRVVSLGTDRKVSICYDVEHMRVAGAWVGKPMVYAADKNMGPSVDGTMVFATKPGPGWAKVGKWEDPREGKEGPLPRDWAHYRGLYLHGEQVVLSYTVGGMSVLEMPGSLQKDGMTIVTRTFNVGPTDRPHSLLVSEEADVIEKQFLQYPMREGKATLYLGATLRPGNVFLAGLVGLGEGKHFRIDQKHRIILDLPALPKGGQFKVFLARQIDTAQFLRLALQSPMEDLAPLTKGGPARWKQTLETTGIPGDAGAGPYVLDQIRLPEQNPWNASIRFAGLDFFPDGRAALCTWDGDVWIVSGLDDKLGKVRWTRFASGLQQPLGLKIIGGIIHTAGRDQITKLHDLNNDGEADFYENFNNDAGLTLQRHEYVMDLQTDRQGNLYYCRSGHYVQSKRGDNCCVYKLSPDGLKLDKFARGFREPNGMSIGPDGTMTVGDNEGNGLPQTPIYRLRQGADYGFVPSASGNVNEGSWKMLERPIVWLGPKVDTSAGGQTWVESDKWGPLQGQLLHTSYGNCALFSVLIDRQAEPWQGAVWKLPLPFTSGIMRGRFHPIDGQLYLCGLRGWGTSAVKDGQFCRVRYTGKLAPIPVGYRVKKDGIALTFSDPLDRAAAEDEDNWAGVCSGTLKKTPSAKEMQEMPITSIRLAADRKTVTIELEKMRIVPNFALQYRLKAADGSACSGEINGTIHRIP